MDSTGLERQYPSQMAGASSHQPDEPLPGWSEEDTATDHYSRFVGRYRLDLGLADTTAHVNVRVECLGKGGKGQLAEKLDGNLKAQERVNEIARDCERRAASWSRRMDQIDGAQHTPDSVLRALCDAKVSDDQRRQLIIQAEMLRFDETQKQQLLPALWEFIMARRASNNLDDVIAVGSAIRKYVANIATENLGSMATLLEEGHCATPPLDVELEIVKMIYRRFEANPPTEADPQPELAERVREMALDYMTPRVLPHGKHATVAMLAVQALAAMLSKRAPEALARVKQLPQAQHWFREQLRRRLIGLREAWAPCPEAVKRLGELTASFNDE